MPSPPDEPQHGVYGATQGVGRGRREESSTEGCFIKLGAWERICSLKSNGLSLLGSEIPKLCHGEPFAWGSSLATPQALCRRTSLFHPHTEPEMMRSGATITYAWDHWSTAAGMMLSGGRCHLPKQRDNVCTLSHQLALTQQTQSLKVVIEGSSPPGIP